MDKKFSMDFIPIRYTNITEGKQSYLILGKQVLFHKLEIASANKHLFEVHFTIQHHADRGHAVVVVLMLMLLMPMIVTAVMSVACKTRKATGLSP